LGVELTDVTAAAAREAAELAEVATGRLVEPPLPLALDMVLLADMDELAPLELAAEVEEGARATATPFETDGIGEQFDVAGGSCAGGAQAAQGGSPWYHVLAKLL
jgi:hypothetical protein